jgi:hypothetical protein
MPTPIEVWQRCIADPVYFAQTLLPKKPHEGQVKWLRNSTQAINVLVPGNRWGKSTVIAMKHIWKCIGKKGLPPLDRAAWRAAAYETISVAMSADQAEIVFKEARRLLSDPIMKPFVTSYRTTPFPAIRFFNGSVMHCRSAHDGGKYIDGHAYRYLSIDEAGWIDELKALMNGVILLRLAGGGEVDLIGTPKGYNDLYFYYNRGARGVDGYYAQRGSIYDNPFLPREDLEMRDRLLASGDAKMREQALFGEFVDYAGLAFTRDQLDQMTDPDLPLKQEYDPQRSYVTAWDLGRVNDFTVGVVLDVTERPWVLVDYIRLNKVAWEEIYATIERSRSEYGCRYAVIDSSGPGGDVIEEEMLKRQIPVWGIKTSSKQGKIELINTLQNALDEGRQADGTYVTVDEEGREHVHPRLEPPGGTWGALRIPPYVQLLDELGLYRFDDKKLVQDSVIALALGARAAYDREAVRAPVMGSFYGGRE